MMMKLFPDCLSSSPFVFPQIFAGAHTVFHPAEVFMSFSSGSDQKQTRTDFGERVSLTSLNANAMKTAQNVVVPPNKNWVD